MPDLHLLTIGIIRKAHGIRGEVSVDYYADSPDLLSAGVYLKLGAAPPALRAVASRRFHHGALLVRFADIVDRNGAELLRGAEMLIPQDRLPQPGDGEIYLHEISGLTVIAVDEDGKETPLGAVSGVSDASGQELWTIGQDGNADILFPATPEFVLRFDLEARTVYIAPPPGLIDLYRS